MSSVALVLIDLQDDFLGSATLCPPRSLLVGRTAALLRRWRAASLPIIHVLTTLRAEEERMAHWVRSGRFQCRAGTAGHAPPSPLQPLAGETVIHKKRFSGFFETELAAVLAARQIDTVILAGVHLHSCVRATALDAYQRDLTVFIAADCAGSDDPLHGAHTQRYLQDRVARFCDSEALLRRYTAAMPPSDAPLLGALRAGARIEVGGGDDELQRPCPSRKSTILWRVREATAEQVAIAARAAKSAGTAWRRSSLKERRRRVEQLASLLIDHREALAQRTALDSGKPILAARGEIDFALAILDAALRAQDTQRGLRGASWRSWRAPVGVVAALTPFNNPVMSFVGKSVPALLFGDTVAWKPAPAVSGVAHAIMDLVDKLELPPGTISLICGDAGAATALLECPEVDAVSLTGGVGAGVMAHAIAAARGMPIQAELGGNNAAVILRDADLAHAAREVARGAFGSAGQRCTANRRVIVEESILDELRQRLVHEASALAWGDPLQESTEIGPLVSERALERTKLVLKDAAERGATLLLPDGAEARWSQLAAQGYYHPPVLALCPQAELELVREETFGPVLVLQPARDLDQALELLSAPRQGLSAALFTRDRKKQRQFLQAARCGLLKINQGTTDTVAEAPFGGWGSSGIGPAEHGPADAELFGRWQTICKEPQHVS
jgi:alpha-ketoglutaric semialdehyde dehydrogenase